jgi:hypothetical protein
MMYGREGGRRAPVRVRFHLGRSAALGYPHGTLGFGFGRLAWLDEYFPVCYAAGMNTPQAIPMPLKTHGGKGAHRGNLARWIVGLMPKHLHYVEPFPGGLSVLLAKNPEGVSEVVNDLDGGLTNFWHVLQGR